MTVPFPIADKDDPRWTKRGGLHVRRSEGTTKWNAGDIYTIKATAEQTGGSLGLIVGSVMPGAGPAAHAHTNEDESFYLLSGELEFLNGDKTFVAEPGDFVFIPRGHRHRFKNLSKHTAELLFFFTPGGQEGFFRETGDDARAGEIPEPWGPERYAPLAPLIGKYGNVLLPEEN